MLANVVFQHFYDNRGRLRATVAGVQLIGMAVLGIARASTSKKDWQIGEQPSKKEGERIALERLQATLGVVPSKSVHPDYMKNVLEHCNKYNLKFTFSGSLKKAIKFARKDLLSANPFFGTLNQEEPLKITLKKTAVKKVAKSTSARTSVSKKKKKVWPKKKTSTDGI